MQALIADKFEVPDGGGQIIMVSSTITFDDLQTLSLDRVKRTKRALEQVGETPYVLEVVTDGGTFSLTPVGGMTKTRALAIEAWLRGTLLPSIRARESLRGFLSAVGATVRAKDSQGTTDLEAAMVCAEWLGGAVERHAVIIYRDEAGAITGFMEDSRLDRLLQHPAGPFEKMLT